METENKITIPDIATLIIKNINQQLSKETIKYVLIQTINDLFDTDVNLNDEIVLSISIDYTK